MRRSLLFLMLMFIMAMPALAGPALVMQTDEIHSITDFVPLAQPHAQPVQVGVLAHLNLALFYNTIPDGNIVIDIHQELRFNSLSKTAFITYVNTGKNVL